MAAKALRQRTRRGSRQDANNVNVSADARAPKEEKGSDDSKATETRQEWVRAAGREFTLTGASGSIPGLSDSASRGG